MQALILAAGRGRRLIPATNRTPKCLVKVNGTPVIVNALNILTRFPMERIVIVVGYLGQKIRAALGDSWNGVPIHYVENPGYLTTNNIYSLWLARDLLDQDTILMECDVFFEERVIQRLMENAGENQALVDRFLPFMDGTVVRVSAGGRINGMIPGPEQDEDFDYRDKFKTVNIYSFREDFLKGRFLPALEAYVREYGRNQFYELILKTLFDAGHADIRATTVQGARWVEIDDFIDLERAEILFADRARLFKKVNVSYGGYWRYDFLDFSYIYNPYFPVPALINELKLNLPRLVGNYPSGLAAIIEKLALWVRMDARYLAVGNGLSEIITVLMRRIVRKIMVPVPTFNEYVARLEPRRINYFYRDPIDFSLDVEAFVKSVRRSRSNVAVVINPNLPTGQVLSRPQVRILARELASLDALILDESFIDFASVDEEVSMRDELRRFKNLVLLRSMSKDLGVPGLRLGYAASANAGIIGMLREEAPIWNINALAEYFLSILPKYRRGYDIARRRVIEDREYFCRALSRIPHVKPLPSAAPYIFVELARGIRSDKLKERLFIDSNILIKDCSNKKGLENKRYVRLSVRAREEIDRFLPEFAAAVRGLKGS